MSSKNHKAKKTYRSKFFRVAVAGATTDGRKIEREWIEQMAATYNRATYGARIWVEHLRSLLPDSPFRAYGDVLALKAEEVEINGEKTLALFAQIQPTDALVNMVNNDKQKLYTSIEVQPDFAASGKAYCVGLAVTDSPASLGTEMLSFAAEHPDKNPLTSRKQSPENLFTTASETVIQLDEVAPAPARTSGFSRLLETIGLAPVPKPEPEAEDDASRLHAFGQQMVDLFNEQETRVEELATQLDGERNARNRLQADFNALKSQLEKAPNGFTQRPPVTGPAGDDATDC
ncbi:GPO family capsid scaffolding protein [Xanthomonas sp. 60]